MWKRVKAGLLLAAGYVIAGFAGWQLYRAIAIGEVEGRRGVVYTWPENPDGFILYVAGYGLWILAALAFPVLFVRSHLKDRAYVRRWRPTFERAARAPRIPEVVDQDDSDEQPAPQSRA